jgi:hypothetical protein
MTPFESFSFSVTFQFVVHPSGDVLTVVVSVEDEDIGHG